MERAGKPFTAAGKQDVLNANMATHDGVPTCENCGNTTVPAQQSTAGVTPPDNETNIDHILPQSRGGGGIPDNGQVLCRRCNLLKSNNYPWP
jgi:5-methylcytosine-specific restriction endonuclease McrA